MSLRLVLVDDSESVRRRLADASTRIPGMELVAEAGTIQQALHDIRELRPDAVVLDIQMPDGSGVGLLEMLAGDMPATVFIMFTSHDLPRYREHCRRAGARLFFPKATGFADLLESLASLAAQHPAIPLVKSKSFKQ